MDCSYLDKIFSTIIREQASWTCALCGGEFADRPEELHCSHYHSRIHKNVRFDPDNCDALCWKCHAHFDQHPAEHEEWKRRQLGEERFERLGERARAIVKLDLQQIRSFLKTLKQAA